MGQWRFDDVTRQAVFRVAREEALSLRVFALTHQGITALNLTLNHSDGSEHKYITEVYEQATNCALFCTHDQDLVTSDLSLDISVSVGNFEQRRTIDRDNGRLGRKGHLRDVISQERHPLSFLLNECFQVNQ